MNIEKKFYDLGEIISLPIKKYFKDYEIKIFNRRKKDIKSSIDFFPETKKIIIKIFDDTPEAILYIYYYMIMYYINNTLFINETENPILWKNSIVHRCVFDEDKNLKNKNVDFISTYTVHTKSNISFATNFLKYKENSCYMDSLLVVMFLSSCNYYTRNIFEKKINEDVSYVNQIISKDYINHIKNILMDYYNKSMLNDNDVCSNLRKLLLKYLKLKKKGEYIMYNSSEIYDFFSDIFSLKIGKNKKFSLFTLIDFVQGDVDVGDDEIIVIRNTLFPPLGKMYKKGSEYFSGNEVIKKNYVSEYIENCNYRLFGIVINHGKIENGKVRAGHYTSMLRLKNNENVWYSYNDLEGKIKYYGSYLSKDFFKNTKNSRPELFFYEKIKSNVEYFQGRILTPTKKSRYIYLDDDSRMTISSSYRGKKEFFYLRFYDPTEKYIADVIKYIEKYNKFIVSTTKNIFVCVVEDEKIVFLIAKKIYYFINKNNKLSSPKKFNVAEKTKVGNVIASAGPFDIWKYSDKGIVVYSSDKKKLNEIYSSMNDMGGHRNNKLTKYNLAGGYVLALKKFEDVYKFLNYKYNL